MTSTRTKSQQADRFLELIPEWLQQLIRVNSLVASGMGVSSTDLHCLHVLQQEGSATPSLLASRVGLTPGAGTRMIDRLVAAGLASRQPDPLDRRKVTVSPTTDGLERAAASYAGLTDRTQKDMRRFTGEELAVIIRFVEQSLDSVTAEAAVLAAVPDER